MSNMFDELPAVRFTIEGLKTKVLHAVSMLTDEMDFAIQAQVEKAIAEFNWEREVRQLTVTCIRSQLEHYFKYGEGYTQIKSAIESGFADKSDKKG